MVWVLGWLPHHITLLLPPICPHLTPKARIIRQQRSPGSKLNNRCWICMCVIVIHGHHHRSYMICGADKHVISWSCFSLSYCFTKVDVARYCSSVLFCSVQNLKSNWKWCLSFHVGIGVFIYLYLRVKNLN